MEELMTKIAKFMKTLKILLVNLTIGSLLQTFFIPGLMAAEAKKNNGFGVADTLSIANGALSIYGSFLGQKQQQIMAQISATNNQKLMAQMSPGCRKADGSACYVSQGTMFPECPLPASMSQMPTNICPSDTMNPSQLSSMITYEAIAQGWMNYYDQMSNDASNAVYKTGVTCLEEKQKAMDSQITEMMNSLQRLQDRLNQDKQIFRDNNKKLLEEMNASNDELFGMSKNNLNMKTQDFAKFFSQSCQSVIGKERLQNGTKEGLNGILQAMSSNNKSAADFNADKSVIENDIRNETNKIASTIASNGLGDFLEKNGNYIPQNFENAKNFTAIGAQIANQQIEFKTAKARIDKTLKDVGYTAPALDSRFSVDMTDFMAGSNDFFKKKYVNDCVTGAEAGVAIPVEDVLKALQQRSTGSQGTARNDYRIALKRVLDSDTMITDKMNQIKALEAEYPDMTVTYKDGTQNRVIETPYQLFMKTIDKCQQRFTQDDTFSSKGSKGISFQKKVERAREALQELKNLNDSFSSKLTQGILSQVLDCGGSAPKAGSCTGEDSLKTENPNFCLSHASLCASQIQGCYSEANQQVQKRKSKMENLSKAFNANVASMIARSNALYDQQKAAVTNITKLIQSRFPGTNFELPKDMFVPMPEMKKDTFGVEMAGDGDLKAILEGENSMPAKLEKLKDMFKKQKDNVNKEAGEYIGRQKAAMTRERGRWEDVYKECKSKVESSSAAMAKMNQNGRAEQAKEDQQVDKFCKKFSSISDNPIGACGKAQDLADIAEKVSRRLSSQAISLSEKYAEVCDGFGNESDDLSFQDMDCSNSSIYPNPKDKLACNQEKDQKSRAFDRKYASGSGKSGKKPTIPLSALCSSDKTTDESFIKEAANKMSAEDKEKFKNTTTLAGASDVQTSGNYFFSQLKSLIEDQDTKEGTICKHLKDIDGFKASTVKDEEKKEKEKAVVEAQTALDKSEDDLRDADSNISKLKLITNPTADDKESLKKAEILKIDKTAEVGKNKRILSNAQRDLKTAETDLASATTAQTKTDEKKQKSKESLAQLLLELTPASPSAYDKKTAEIQEIGEQMTGPCDMQNTSMASKGMQGLFDLPAGFDEARLGTAK
jgi:hypothetical protein